MKIVITAIIACFIYSFQGHAAVEEIDPYSRLTPTPDWVVKIAPVAKEAAQFPSKRGVKWLLYDDQFDRRDNNSVWYQRRVVETTTVKGVEKTANFRWKYDPSYTIINLHEITIIRDGVRLDGLKGAHMEILRQESGLNRNIYDGKETLYVRLADVRPGDIVDYSLSWVGENPSFKGHFSRTQSIDWRSNIERQHLRLQWPKDVTATVRRGEVALIPQTNNGRNVVTFGPQPREFKRSQRGTPNGITDFEKITISNYDGWKDVIAVAEPYFSSPVLGPDTRAIVDQIIADHPTFEARMTAAIRFVQDDIRYQAISLGSGGWVPRDPDIVLDSRYGDCKDKSVLMALMAEAIGADEAYVALVHTKNGAGLAAKTASMTRFNHAITVIEHDGARYFIDGTRRMQGGMFGNLDQSFHHYALLMRPGETGLVSMPYPEPELLMRDSSMTYDFSAGPGQPAIISATNVYRGAWANGIRSAIANSGMDGMAEINLRGLEGLFGETEEIDVIDISDDREANVITLASQYRLLEPYEIPIEEGVVGGEITIDALQGARLIDKFAKRRRTLPLNLSNRLHMRESIEFILPESMDIELLDSAEKRADIDNAGFAYTKTVTHGDHTLTMVHTVRSKGPMVQPEMARDVFRDVRRMKAYTSTTLLIPEAETTP